MAASDEAPRISVNEVLERINRNEGVIFVDTRNPVAWAESGTKIKGAVRVPADEINQRLRELPRGGPVVTYCT